MLKFIVAYVFFMFFIIFMIGIGSPAFMSEGLEKEIKPPVCVITNILNMIGCVGANIGFFFKLTNVSSSIRVLSIVLFTPLVIVMVWVLISFLRGTGWTG